MGRGKLEAWQTSGMANQRNRRLKKSWQTRGVANLVIENAGKLKGVANQWHACPPNSGMDYENELKNHQRPITKKVSKTPKVENTTAKTNAYKNKLRSS